MYSTADYDDIQGAADREAICNDCGSCLGRAASGQLARGQLTAEAVNWEMEPWIK